MKNRCSPCSPHSMCKIMLNNTPKRGGGRVCSLSVIPNFIVCSAVRKSHFKYSLFLSVWLLWSFQWTCCWNHLSNLDKVVAQRYTRHWRSGEMLASILPCTDVVNCSIMCRSQILMRRSWNKELISFRSCPHATTSWPVYPFSFWNIHTGELTHAINYAHVSQKRVCECDHSSSPKLFIDKQLSMYFYMRMKVCKTQGLSLKTIHYLVQKWIFGLMN